MTVESTAARKPRRSSKRTAGAGAKKTAAEPELVQLLTPEGERVEHPDYDVDLSAEELRGLYRDMVLTRRFDAEATSLQRQGELGLWASLLGQEAAQIGSGRALRDDDYVFPTYREHGVAWCRGVDPTNLLGMFRGVNHGGWDPNTQQFPPVHDRHRLADAARDRVRDGRRQGRRGQRRDRLLRRRRVQPGRRRGGLHLLRRLQRPGRVLLPEQPVGDLRAHREADARAALPARAGLRLPRRAGRRQRRAGLPRRDQVRPGAGPPRRRAHPGRGVHLPDGRAHHLRRPDEVPGRRGARGVGGQGPDPAPARLPGDRGPRGRRVLRGAGDRVGDARQAGA